MGTLTVTDVPAGEAKRADINNAFAEVETVVNGQIGDGNLASNEIVPADHLRQGAWTTYVPTLTASTSDPTLGSGSTADGRHARQADRLIVASITMTFGSSGAAAGSGTYRISLPVSCLSETRPKVIGSGYVYDDSTSALLVVSAYVLASTTTYCQLVVEAGSLVTHAAPWTWAENDEISLQLTYEAAS